MKLRKYFLPALLTLLALTIGYLLPQAVSAVEDRRTHAISNSFAAENVTLNFTPEMSVGEKMELAAQGIQYSVEVDGGKKLNADTAEKTARTFFENLSTIGITLSSDQYKISSVLPYLEIFSDSASTSCLVWCCSAQYDSGVYINLTIDDETGCVLAFTYSCVPEKETETDSSVPNSMLKKAYALASYLTKEYGFLDFSLEPEDNSNGFEYTNEKNYVLTLINNDGKTYKTSLVIGYSYFLFND